jgi:hypothetical protein
MNAPQSADQDLTPEQLARFDEASNHPYECRCDLCREWWELMGPEREGDEEEPFTPGVDGCEHGAGFDEDCERCNEEIDDAF